MKERDIELAALGGLQSLGHYGLADGPELAPGEPASLPVDSGHEQN